MVDDGRMRTFEVRGAVGESNLRFSCAGLPVSGYDGWSFEAALQGSPVSVSVTVYDRDPRGWSEFFAGLASDWRGWNGEKAHESLAVFTDRVATVVRVEGGAVISRAVTAVWPLDRSTSLHCDAQRALLGVEGTSPSRMQWLSFALRRVPALHCRAGRTTARYPLNGRIAA